MFRRECIEGGPLLPIEADELPGIGADGTCRRRIDGRREFGATRNTNECRARLDGHGSYAITRRTRASREDASGADLGLSWGE